jgi:hypothetical protein
MWDKIGQVWMRPDLQHAVSGTQNDAEQGRSKWQPLRLPPIAMQPLNNLNLFITQNL